MIDTRLVTVAYGYQRRLLQIRDRSAATIGGLWDRVVTDPGDAAATRFTTLAGPLADASQRAAAAISYGYVEQYNLAAGEGPVQLGELPDYSAIRGVPSVDVYHRSIVTVRTALAAGSNLIDAISEGRARAVQTAATDPMIAARQAVNDAMAKVPRIVGYRRVTDGNACPFCVLASTQRYHVGQLMPVHPTCGCTTAPIYGSVDPGRVLDRSLVDRLMTADPALGKRGDTRDKARAAASERLAQAEELIAVHEHGELGPVLYGATSHFTPAPA